ncbi:MAG TPA: hypothetical protein PLE30_03570 [Candidatus Kapabacteria bacterium]|nr:hypothetical protein [Candidatus Kapabacteria bacterium]
MPTAISLFALSFFLEIYQIFSLGSTGVTFSDVITMGMFLYFIKYTIWDGKTIKISKNPAILFLFLFYIITLISGFAPISRGISGEMTQFIKSLSHYHFSLLFLTINILISNKNETWENFIKIWIVASIFINIFGIYQIIARGLNLPLAWLEIGNNAYLARGMYDNLEDVSQISLKFGNFFRATSIFSEPSALAAFDALVLVFLIIPYIQNFKPFLKSKFLTITSVISTILGLLLAFSLTGLTSFGLVIGSIILFEKFKNLKLFVKILFFLIIFLIIADQIVTLYFGISIFELFYKRIYGVIQFLLTNQVSAIEGESFSGRSDNASAMFNIFTHNPIIGTGLGLTSASPYSDGWFFADITIMAVLAETGIIGFFAYISFSALLLFQSIKFLVFRDRYTNIDDSQRRLQMILFYILMIYIVVNYLSGNQLLNVFSLIMLSLIFNVIDNYYLNYLKKFYEVKFVNKPLSIIFKQALLSNVSNSKLSRKVNENGNQII